MSTSRSAPFASVEETRAAEAFADATYNPHTLWSRVRRAAERSLQLTFGFDDLNRPLARAIADEVAFGRPIDLVTFYRAGTSRRRSTIGVWRQTRAERQLTRERAARLAAQSHAEELTQRLEANAIRTQRVEVAHRALVVHLRSVLESLSAEDRAILERGLPPEASVDSVLPPAQQVEPAAPALVQAGSGPEPRAGGDEPGGSWWGSDGERVRRG